MDYDQDIKTANTYASDAIEKMHALEISPTPDHFAVWYVYFANLNPDVKDAVNHVLSTETAVTDAHCKEIYAKFLSDERHKQIYERAGDQIHSTLRDVSGLMDNVKSATSEYGGTLEGVNVKLSNAKSAEDIQTILEDVASDTVRMMEQNQLLEQQLDQSSKAMDELKHDLERVRLEAMTDGLTGLANRKCFDERIEETVSLSEKSDKIFTLLMLDIDHFKSFNDNYGHQVGDQVLRLVARTLIDGVKGKDTAARYGGEEFSIILPDTDLNSGVMVAENLRKAIATKEVINRASGEQLGRITISAGVAQFSVGEQVASLIERADSALYTAKHNGRNQVAAAPTPAQKKAV